MDVDVDRHRTGRRTGGRTSRSTGHRPGHGAGPRSRLTRALAPFVALAVALVPLAAVPLVALGAVVAAAPPAAAAPAGALTADALPTVQTNGTAWAQVVVGNTVYVAGDFTSARPAGAAAGTDETPRGRLLAYDIRTGVLVPGWAPTINAAGRSIAASPDGRRIYVGGDFTSASGKTRNRLAAFDAATGALLGVPALSPNSTVRSIVATASTVYVGGNFTTVSGQTRARVAAFDASTGALRAFAPNVQPAQVEALALTPDGRRLVVAGRFQRIGGAWNPGIGWVDASSGAVLRFPANAEIQNYGYSAGILSLQVTATRIIASGFGYLKTEDGSAANLEGVAAMDVGTGALAWVSDCHGDTYDTFASADGGVYVAGHPHDCGNVAGFPETSPVTFRYGIALGQEPAGVTVRNADAKYTDVWEGRPRPALRTWFPVFAPGTWSGQKQAGWDVTGNDEYVVYAGEFPTVNGRAQAGLVRFARAGTAPGARGPQLTGTAVTPVGASRGAGAVQLSWPVNWDPDDAVLTYTVRRDGAVVGSFTHASQFWDRSRVSFDDTGVPSGAHTYQVVVTDAGGASVTSPTITVSMNAVTPLGAYATAVLDDRPSHYWRLDDTGTSMTDMTAAPAGTMAGATVRQPTALHPGSSTGAVSFSGSAGSGARSGASEAGTDTVSVEAWFRTTTTRGGKIVGFGSAATGSSGSYDRHVWMSDDGRVSFGVRPRVNKVVTSGGRYNDGAWHHVVGTLGPAGQRLYLDGALVAADPLVVSAQTPLTGYWRVGGDALSGWSPTASSGWFAGTLDEVATYHAQLSPERVAAHHAIGTTGATTTPPANTPPAAAFTATATDLSVALDGRTSADGDGTVTAWAWDLGDGRTATGPTVQHTYAAAGTYTVRLAVTDDDGATGSATRTVTVTAPTAPPPATVLAADTFAREVTGGFGTAETGGAWTTTAGVASVTGGVGQLRLPGANAGGGARLGGVSGRDVVVRSTLSLDRLANGAGAYLLVRARIQPDDDSYRLKLQVSSSGAVSARLVRAVGGVETTVAGPVAAGTVAAGQRLRTALAVTGTAPSTVRAKVWRDGAAEPTTWTLTATDATADLQGAGSVGFFAALSSSTTNGPVVVGLDDLEVTDRLS